MLNIPPSLLARLGPFPPETADLHIVRLFAAYAAISQGRVLGTTPPGLRYCPLAEIFYGRHPPEDASRMIRQILEDKVRDFGHYTERREVVSHTPSVPFGASEMMMAGLQKRVIEAAVVVCEGAGTVITATPEVAQGIGGRMNALFFTTPLPGLIRRLEAAGGQVPFPATAAIDQIAGVREAARRGYSRIAVTLNAAMEESFAELRGVEAEVPVALTILAVCTTGISAGRAEAIRRHADLVWSCASGEVREQVGRAARLQISLGIPVFALTERGLQLAAAFGREAAAFAGLDPAKQYLLSVQGQGRPLRMAGLELKLQEQVLPQRSKREPH